MIEPDKTKITIGREPQSVLTVFDNGSDPYTLHHRDQFKISEMLACSGLRIFDLNAGNYAFFIKYSKS